MATGFLRALVRRKPLEDDGESKLARVLNLVDLTALGVGSTLGLGVYILAGSVARNQAGPAVCLSFLVAAIASAFAGLCYAEFASRVPKAGSAYVYSYVSVGELAAFIIGWNLILEYVIGTSSVARGFSNYIDALANKTMETHLTEALPINVSFLSPYPDFLSFGLIMLLTILLAAGVKESTILNNVFTVINLVTIATAFIAGLTKVDINNWKIKKEDIPSKYTKAGEGGFLPFGVSGVMAGAATCFYGFVGFDAVATTGEEAKKPQKNIPLAIVISLLVIFVAYFGISSVLTLLWPYYDQDEKAPFPYVFEQIGWPVIKWIVTVGAIFALCTSMLGAMFPLPRILYAMAKDGLIFMFLAKIHPRFQTPVIATVISGLFAGVMAMIFDLQQLVDMMSIGTLLAYTIVAICVLILRYAEEDPFKIDSKQIPSTTSNFNFLRQLFNLNMIKRPTAFSSMVTNWAVALFCVLSICLGSVCTYAPVFSDERATAGFIILLILCIFNVIIIARQPISDAKLNFKVPCLPWLPCLSIFINLYLMLQLDEQTWIRFAVWMIAGFMIYFFYGIYHSEERLEKKQEKRPSLAATASIHSENKSSDNSPTLKKKDDKVTKF